MRFEAFAILRSCAKSFSKRIYTQAYRSHPPCQKIKYSHNIDSCAHAHLCTTDSCARFESLKSLAGNPIFPPKHQLRGHKKKTATFPWKLHKEDCSKPSRPHNHHYTTTWIFCMLCFCQRGRISFFTWANLWHRGSPVNCYCSTLIIALVLLMSLEPLVLLRNWIFCVICCCKGGGFSIILRELIFGTMVLPQLLLQHTHLRIDRETEDQQSSINQSIP